MLALGAGALFIAVLVGVATLLVGREQRAATNRIAEIVSAHASSPGEASSDEDAAPFMAPLWLLGRTVASALAGGAGSRRKLSRRLDLAGNPARWTAERLLAVKGLGLLGGGTLGVLLTIGEGLGLSLFAGLGAAAAGFFLPDLLLYNVGTKRQQQISQALADSLDLLVISVQAGLGFDAALAQVARNTTGPLAQEYGRVLREMQIGKSRREAFDALSERTTATDVRHFVGAVVQADALGVPIAGVLGEQAKEMRVRRRQNAEAQAQKVPVKILFPLMFFVLPTLFIIVLGPGVLQMMAAFR